MVMQISEWISLPDEEGESAVEVLAKRVVDGARQDCLNIIDLLPEVESYASMLPNSIHKYR